MEKDQKQGGTMKNSEVVRVLQRTRTSRLSAEAIDNQGWTNVGSTETDSLNPVDAGLMDREAYQQWIRNPLAYSIIEMRLDFIMGDGPNIKANDDRVKEVIDSFYENPENRLDDPDYPWIRDLLLYGELVFIPEVSPFAGDVEVASIYPDKINAVYKDKYQYRARALQIKDYGIGTAGIIKWDRLSRDYRGDAWYFAINRTGHQTRGLSDLFTSRDWLNMYNKAMFTTMERIGMLLSFVWDIVIEGADKTALEQKEKSIRQNPPRPGSWRIHNEKEKWSAVTPSLNGSSLDDIFRLLKSQTIAGSITPEHYFGMGGNVNLATAQVMNEPFMRMIRRRQRKVLSVLRAMFDYQIHQKKKANMLIGVEDFGYSVSLPQPDSSIVRQVSENMDKFSRALVVLSENGLITKSEGKQVIDLMIKKLGVEQDHEGETDDDPAYKGIENAIKKLQSAGRGN